MGNRHGKKLTRSEVNDLRRRCSFSTDHILDMHRDFVREYPSGRISRKAFMTSYQARFPHADHEFCERLFHAHDFDDNGDVSFDEFLISLDVAINGTTEARLRWAFRMFDIDKDGTATRSEIVVVLKVRYLVHRSQTI